MHNLVIWQMALFESSCNVTQHNAISVNKGTLCPYDTASITTYNIHDGEADLERKLARFQVVDAMQQVARMQ